MAALDLWQGRLMVAHKARYGWQLLAMAVRGDRLMTVRITVLASTLVLLLFVFVQALLSQSSVPTWVTDRLADHEARLKTKTEQIAEMNAKVAENDRKHTALENSRLLERIVRLETNSEAAMKLLGSLWNMVSAIAIAMVVVIFEMLARLVLTPSSKLRSKDMETT